MGAKQTKFQQLYKKLARRQKQLNKQQNFAEFDTNDDDQLLLLPMSSGTQSASLVETGPTTNFELRNDANLSEIRQMKQELSARIQQVHIALDKLELQHNRELNECANEAKSLKTSPAYPTIIGDPKLEECRLRNALLVERLKSCHEQLNRNDDPIFTIKQKEGKDKNTFMRQLLMKTARRQFKKSRLNDAIETFYQLVVATNGQLCANEAWLLFDICSQKIAGTYEFYHRISHSVHQLEHGTSKYIINELWSSIVEDLRNECSELYDIVMSVHVEAAEPVEESCVVEKLKYLTSMRVCALWLQITPLEHEEFDDVKEMFYDSLNKDVEAFANLVLFDNNNIRVANVFHTVIEDLCTKYPVVSKTRKLQKIAAQILGQNPNGATPFMLKDR